MFTLLICLSCGELQDGLKREAATLAAEIATASETRLEAICDRLIAIGPEGSVATTALLKRRESATPDSPLSRSTPCWETITAMGPEAVPTLQAALRSGNKDSQTDVLYAVEPTPEFEELYPDILKLAKSKGDISELAVSTLSGLPFNRDQTAGLLADRLADSKLAWDAYVGLVKLQAGRTVYRRVREVAVNSKDIELRRIASICLAELDESGQFGIPVLCRLLDDKRTIRAGGAFSATYDEPVGRNILRDLAEHPACNRADGKALLRAAKRFDSGYAFATLCFLLAETNTQESVPLLRKKFDAVTTEGYVRVAAAAALLRLDPKPDEAREYLIGLLTNEKIDPNMAGGGKMPMSPSLRDRAARALGCVAAKQRDLVLPALRRAMGHQAQDEMPSSMASEAAWSVARLDRKDRDCIRVLAKSNLSASWIDSPWYRVSPSQVASVLGDRIDLLAAALAETAMTYDNGSNAMQYSQAVLLATKPPRVRELIRAGFAAIENEDRYDGNTALGWLIRLAPELKTGHNQILRRCQSSNVRSRSAAVYLLGRMNHDPKTSVPALIRGTRDKRVLVRYRAVKALALFGSEARTAIPDLKGLTKDEYASVRRAANEAIGSIRAE
jgi:HEAT repeat protein